MTGLQTAVFSSPLAHRLALVVPLPPLRDEMQRPLNPCPRLSQEGVGSLPANNTTLPDNPLRGCPIARTCQAGTGNKWVVWAKPLTTYTVNELPLANSRLWEEGTGANSALSVLLIHYHSHSVAALYIFFYLMYSEQLYVCECVCVSWQVDLSQLGPSGCM